MIGYSKVILIEIEIIEIIDIIKKLYMNLNFLKGLHYL